MFAPACWKIPSSLLGGFATQLPWRVSIAVPMPFFFFFQIGLNTTSFNCSQLHFLFPNFCWHRTIWSWTETQIIQFVCACCAAHKMRSSELPAGALGGVGGLARWFTLADKFPSVCDPVRSATEAELTQRAALSDLWHDANLRPPLRDSLPDSTPQSPPEPSLHPSRLRGALFSEAEMITEIGEEGGTVRLRVVMQPQKKRLTSEAVDVAVLSRHRDFSQQFPFCCFPANSGGFDWQTNILTRLQ